MSRVRKFDPGIPKHIDQNALPKGVYWDGTGQGRWFIFELDDGRKRRKTIAGPAARLSELHAMVEDADDTGTVEWVCTQYHASAKFKKLARLTRADYEYSRDVMLAFPTSLGVKFGQLKAAKLRNQHFQRMIDRLENDGTPTKANKVLRYSRLVFRWALNRGLVPHNPVQGLEAAEERKLRRNPEDEVYNALLAFARKGAAVEGRTRGSLAPYLPYVMELGYLCRLRGIETITLTEAHGTPEGLRTNRRKGSRDNLVEWTPRLRAAWDGALALRRALIARRKRPEAIRADQRIVIVSESCEPLTKSSLDTTWQRFIHRAIAAGVITAEQRFGLHDLKRKGGTDTVGNRAEKQDALGVSEAMMAVYDQSVPVVRPTR
jgi:site-specific recombinase XerC